MNLIGSGYLVHGRILQARFNESGILKVRVSPIYSFLRKAEAPFKLFLRYYACEPQDGPEYELYNDIEDAPIQVPKYVSSEPRYDKKCRSQGRPSLVFSGES